MTLRKNSLSANQVTTVIKRFWGKRRRNTLVVGNVFHGLFGDAVEL